MKKESEYKLRKKIKELEVANETLRDNRDLYKFVTMNIFDSLVACKDHEYIRPLALLGMMKPLITGRFT